jgi:Centriolar protein SAS N-terminal
MGLKINFPELLTMLIKLINQCIEDPEQFKCILIMNSDSTATLKIFKVLEFKSLDQLTITLKLGDVETLKKHVSFRYKIASFNLK